MPNAATPRLDYRTGLPVPASLSGKLYSVHDLFAPKLAADEAPIIAARAEQKARSAAIIAAARASIEAQCAALGSPALLMAAE